MKKKKSCLHWGRGTYNTDSWVSPRGSQSFQSGTQKPTFCTPSRWFWLGWGLTYKEQQTTRYTALFNGIWSASRSSQHLIALKISSPLCINTLSQNKNYCNLPTYVLSMVEGKKVYFTLNNFLFMYLHKTILGNIMKWTDAHIYT